MIKDDILAISKATKHLSKGELHELGNYSISKILDGVTPQFDKEGMAEHCYAKYYDRLDSKYFHMTKEMILENWDGLARHAKQAGGVLDSYTDAVLYGNDEEKNRIYLANPDSVVRNKLNSFQSFYDNEIRRVGFEFIDREIPLYDREFNINGRLDACFEYGGILYVVDWKNTAEIRTTSREFLFGPLSSWQNTEYNRYCLQVYFYRYMLEHQFGIRCPIRTMIVQIREDGYQIYIPTMDYDVDVLSRVVQYSTDKILESNAASINKEK